MCFKYRHYLSDIISVKTNQTVKEEEGVCLYFVSALTRVHTCANEQVGLLSAL